MLEWKTNLNIFLKFSYYSKVTQNNTVEANYWLQINWSALNLHSSPIIQLICWLVSFVLFDGNVMTESEALLTSKYFCTHCAFVSAFAAVMCLALDDFKTYFRCTLCILAACCSFILISSSTLEKFPRWSNSSQLHVWLLTWWQRGLF